MPIARPIKSLVALALGAGALILGQGAAWANTLATAVPASGSVLITAPGAISLTTTSPLADQGSTIAVTDPTGKQVDDGSITITGDTAQVGLQALNASGVYTVNYTLVATADTPLIGTYTFIYQAPPTATSAPTPISTALPTTKPSVVKVSHTADLVVYILLTVATLVLVLLFFYARLLFVNSRKRKRSSRKRPAARKNSRE